MSRGGTPALANATSNFPQFSQYPVTSVRRDTPGTGLGHRQGRAVDVAVPDDEQGFNYVVKAAQSGQFLKIGTNPRWIPTLQRAFPNVYFFPDYAQVHAHLEVGQ